jgi:MGT family glycosyltransferase
MARFLITTWPLPGHLYPQVALAHALRRRGHEVAFYTGGSAAALLEAEGFTHYPFRAVDEEAVYGCVHMMESQTVGWRAPMLLQRVLRDWWVETVPGQIADLQDVLAAWRPDVLACDPTVWAPYLVLRELPEWRHIPVAVSSFLIACLIPGPGAPPWGPGLPLPRTLGTRLLSRSVAAATRLLAWRFRDRINALRAAYGLPPESRPVAALTGDLPLYLVPSLPRLDYDRKDIPSNVHYVGPCVWNRQSAEAPPAWLDQLDPALPLVHVTEGTVHYQDPFVLQAAAQGLAGRPVQVVMTTGGNRDPASLELGPAAPNVRVERWVSHSHLLPRCSVVVTTGGAGTIMAALSAGVPLVVVPTHWDKPDNAQRIVAAGVGLRLSPQRCTPDRLREAVERVLAEPHFRVAAQSIARELAAAPGPDGAALLLEGLSKTHASSASPEPVSSDSSLDTRASMQVPSGVSA